MKSRKLLPALVAALLLACLTGCSMTPGTAATVNDVKISADDVMSLKAGCEQAQRDAGGQVGVTKYDMVYWLVMAELGHQLADTNQIKISESDQKSYLARLDPSLQALQTDPECMRGLMGISYYGQAIAKLNSEDEAEAFFNSAEVKVNPRFGQWDSARLSITPPSGGELASLPKVSTR